MSSSRVFQTMSRSRSTTRDSIEMHPVQEDDSNEIEMPSLPPTDHGKQAYLVLIGCTLIQAPVWGKSSISLAEPSNVVIRLFALLWGLPGILYHTQKL